MNQQGGILFIWGGFLALSRLGVKLRGVQRPDQRKHRLLHHHHQVLPRHDTARCVWGGASSGRSQPRARLPPHDQRSGLTRRLQPITLALRPLAVVTYGGHGRDLASPVPPFCFFPPPALSYQGGVSCEAPRRYRTPHGVLCVRMFVTSVATRKWSPRHAA